MGDGDSPGPVAAIVVAAGLSRRMGRPKMALPLGGTTVIGRVVDVLAQGGVDPLVVVTGGARDEVIAALSNRRVILAYNQDFANGEMLVSLQVGIKALPAGTEACLVALGDQPQIEGEVVAAIVGAYRKNCPTLLVPSFQMRRGHPWLIHRLLWPDLLALTFPSTARDFLNKHAEVITYLPVDHPSVLQDLDTPEDYHKMAKSGGG